MLFTVSWSLFKCMIREEWRIHKTLLGGFGSGFFPVLIFSFTTFGALITPSIRENIELSSILLMLHLGAFFYGFFVGGLGILGENVISKKLGQVNLLLQLPHIYPVSFKQVMGVFYIKDALFYLMYSLVPLVLGIGTVAPHVGVSYGSITILGVTLFLVFMMGMGVSFMLSTIFARSRKIMGIISVLIFSLILLVYPLKMIPFGYVFPALAFWETHSVLSLVFSALISLAFAVVAILFTQEQYTLNQHRYPGTLLTVEKRFRPIGSLQTILSKEWLELHRSKSLFPAVAGFGGQLMAVYFVSWIFQTGFSVPLNFNVVFFSGFVGFMGVMTYSVLTNIEHNEYLNLIPVTVDRVVKAKLLLYLLSTSLITVGYVFVIGLLKAELYYVPLSLGVAMSTSIFVVIVVAYLTGLWTNTMFFGVKTIMKFSAIVVPPLILLEIASLMLQSNVQTAMKIIIITSLALFAASCLIYTQLQKKWKDSGFSYMPSNI